MAPLTETEPPLFVHLKVHSSYSLLEGALTISQLAKLAVEHRHPALALTDTNNLFGCLEFSEKLAAAGVQPIAAVSLAIEFDRSGDAPAPGSVNGARREPHRDGLIALYAMNGEGYASLMKLVSHAHMASAEADGPHVRFADLARWNVGLIALTGGPDGPIDRALAHGQREVADQRLRLLAEIFGDRLYVELQRHGLARENEVEPALIALAYSRRIPLVATNECYFAQAEDWEAHDALLCIAEGRYVVEDDRRRVSQEHYFKSAAQMIERFADLPEAVASTVEIARRCAFRVTGRKPILPGFVALGEGASDADRIAAEADELIRQAKAGLQARLEVAEPAPGFTREDYDKRLAYECDVIVKMKFPGYFLIVADFIQWSKANGVPVGPGRGSGAGSLVAWALTITDLDPMRFGLLFERFLNPERVSMPDFDIDFCQDRRERTIRYVQDKYGHDRVAQIITHGKLQARAVLRDVGRVLQMPYGQVDRLCKLVPNNPANPVTLAQAIEAEPRLKDAIAEEPIVARLFEIAGKLEGLYRHASTHAAGMVIGDRPLDELVPLYRDPKSAMPVTQFNWKMVEAAGLVKFDFLGLKTLTVLDKAVELIRAGRGIEIDLARLPLDDTAAYELLARAETVGVFQLESTGMRESLRRLRPDRFEDIIAMVALYRPGPMDNIPTYINRKHGEEPVDCLHPMLEGILRETYGVIIYQEQVIQIAQVMGGYTLGQADLLRRAMGKKDKAEMAAQQARFVEGAKAKGVAPRDAAYIFELVDKFAGYGFNKSHAAAYALVSYHTAYLKANFPEEFLAASMTLDIANTDKLAVFAAEARSLGIALRPPSVNASDVEFSVEWDGGGDARAPEGAGSEATPRGAIRYALAALKNIGAAAVTAIVEERERGGAFRDLADFAARLPAKALNKRALETLAQAGALEGLEPDRALATANAEQILAVSNRLASEAQSGTTDLFGGAAADGKAMLDLKPAKPWTPMERLDREFQAVGFYLSGHPLDQYESVRGALGLSTYAEFLAATERGATAARIGAIVVSARERKSSKGNKFAFAMFSDASGQFEAVIFADTLSASRELLAPGTPIVVAVEAEREGESLRMRAQSIESLARIAGGVQRTLVVELDPALAGTNGKWKAALAELRSALKPGRSEIRLALRLRDEQARIELPLAGRFDAGPQAQGVISTVPGVVGIEIQ